MKPGDRLSVTVNTGNASFAEGCDIEVARILRTVADSIEYSGEPKAPFDINGNSVGSAVVTSGRDLRPTLVLPLGPDDDDDYDLDAYRDELIDFIEHEFEVSIEHHLPDANRYSGSDDLCDDAVRLTYEHHGITVASPYDE